MWSWDKGYYCHGIFCFFSVYIVTRGHVMETCKQRSLNECLSPKKPDKCLGITLVFTNLLQHRFNGDDDDSYNSHVWVLLTGCSSIPCLCHLWYHGTGGLRSSGWDSGRLREAWPLAPRGCKFIWVCISVKLSSLLAALVGSFSYSQ